MSIFHRIESQAIRFSYMENTFSFEKITPPTLQSVRGTVSAILADVLMSLGAEIIACIFMQTRLNCTMLNYSSHQEDSNCNLSSSTAGTGITSSPWHFLYYNQQQCSDRPNGSKASRVSVQLYHCCFVKFKIQLICVFGF